MVRYIQPKHKELDAVCVKDETTGEFYGWGRVLDYIGVGWEDRYIDWEKQQMNIFDFPGVMP